MEYRMLEKGDIFVAMEGGKSRILTGVEKMPEGKKHTVKEIEALAEGERAELIDGELYMMAAPTMTHQDILGWLNMRIRLYIMEKNGACKVLPAPFAVYIKEDDHNYVEPDLSVICDVDKLGEKGCHGAPDWVIEIVSPSSKVMDCVRKHSLYGEAGVREYWVVDPEERSVVVYGFAHDFSKQYSFTDRVKAGIYEDLYIDFSELE